MSRTRVAPRPGGSGVWSIAASLDAFSRRHGPEGREPGAGPIGKARFRCNPPRWS